MSVYIQGRQGPTSPSSYGHHPGNDNEAISGHAMMDIRKAKRQTKEAESLKCTSEQGSLLSVQRRCHFWLRKSRPANLFEGGIGQLGEISREEP